MALTRALPGRISLCRRLCRIYSSRRRTGPKLKLVANDYTIIVERFRTPPSSQSFWKNPCFYLDGIYPYIGDRRDLSELYSLLLSKINV